MDAKFERVKTNWSPNEIWRIWRNVIVIGFAFMIHFTAFWGASNLQSSINTSGALGTFTLAAIYGSLILSNIFLPVIVIRWLGAKWAIAISFITYMPFMISQFWPRFYTMIPAGLAVGFGGGPLWCAKCTYLTVISETYAEITGISSDIVVTRFFGVFFMFYQFSQVWGNLISSAVLSTGSSISNSTEQNETLGDILPQTTTVLTDLLYPSKDNNDYFGEYCGANFCPAPDIISNVTASVASTTIKNLTEIEEAADNWNVDQGRINIVFSIYLACMLAAFLIVAFGVDSIQRYGRGRKGSGSGLSGLNLLAVTMKQLANPYQLLILPITMFIGAEQAFIAADFNAAFVSCAWGVSNIGFVMICFGVSNGITAIFTGSIVKTTGRGPVISLALSTHVALIVTLLIWRPNPAEKNIFFLIAALWGMCDAVWLVQINSLSGILFPGKEEASYSNFRLWESTGSVITYAYSPYLCLSVKLYLLLGLLLIGIIGYTCVEYLECKKGKHLLPSAELTSTINGQNGKFELVTDNSAPPSNTIIGNSNTQNGVNHN